MTAEPEIIWRGLRYWTMEPTGEQIRGWNTCFIPYTVTKKTAKRITLHADTADLARWPERMTARLDHIDVQLNRIDFEQTGKVYHSRFGEYFYRVKPAVDPEKQYSFTARQSSTALSALGLPPSATKEQIKRAYKRLARKAHPDGGGSHDAFLKLNEAYEQAMRF